MCSRKLSGCGWLKLFLKNAGGGKNKKHRVGQRVGLEAVRLQYRLNVFGHLSKWFTFLSFLVVCLILYGRLLRLHSTYIYVPQTFTYTPIYFGCVHQRVAYSFFKSILYLTIKKMGDYFF